VLDSKPRILPVRAWCPSLSVATDGSHVVLGYVTGYLTYEMHALILDSDGESVADVRLSAGEASNVAPAIAWNGSFFAAVWEGHAARFDANGTLGPTRSVSLLDSAINTPHIASDGNDFVVIQGSLVFRMRADLVAEFLVSLPFANVKSIAWTGSSYVIANVVPNIENGYLQQGNVTILRLDREGHLLAQREMQSRGVAAHPAIGPAVATNGQNLLVAWHDPTTPSDAAYPDADTYASIVSLPELTPEPRKLLSVAAGWQLSPSTGVSGSNHLTVWQEATGLYARRHRRDGSTDDSPLRLTTTQATSLAVVFNGSDFIVASTEGAVVVTRLLPVTGELRVDREWRFDGKSPRNVALASNGAVTVATWIDGGLYAARTGADGSLIDKVPLEVATELLAVATHRIAIAPNRDGEFLLVWGGTIPACSTCSPYWPPQGVVLRAARVTSTLTLLDQPAIEIVIPVAPFDARADPASPRYDPRHSLYADEPSATWNGNEWLVVWNRGFQNVVAGTASNQEEIRGRRVARNGTLLDGSPNDPGILIARNAFAPTVAWTGTAYVLGWYEGSPEYRWGFPPSFLQQIHAASLDRIGGPLSNERKLGESSVPSPVSIAVSADGIACIAYARLGDAPRYGGVSRAFLDILTSDSRRRAVHR
jgi:hypothetical protein